MPKINPDAKFVAMGKHQCPVCLTIFEANELIIHRRLWDIPDNTISGVSLCPEHAKQKKDGYIFFIELKGDEQGNSTITNKDAFSLRTGAIAAMRKELAEDMLNVAPENINYCSIEFFDKLQKLQKESQK